MNRLKIPSLCQQFVIGLFTNRYNRVITPFGLTESYHIKIGIDQGETISPLLWVIYYDPLLTMLKNRAIDPYTLEHSKITSIDPYIVERSSYDISSLVFMDDSTLVSSSKKGIEKLLSITEEFYYLNNTAANHSKYVLISNSLMNINPITFNLDTSVLNYRPSITIKPLKKSESFRFLGCWFNMDHKPNFVRE